MFPYFPKYSTDVRKRQTNVSAFSSQKVNNSIHFVSLFLYGSSVIISAGTARTYILFDGKANAGFEFKQAFFDSAADEAYK